MITVRLSKTNSGGQSQQTYTTTGITVKGEGWTLLASVYAEDGYVAGTLNYAEETSIVEDMVI